jgi:hypothetical protein
MKKLNLILISLGLSFSHQVLAAQQAHLDEARSLAKQFGGQLQPELGKAMKAGGPINAISVCHTKAPQIAAELSEKSGWIINRVSLKNRSPKGEPDGWETVMLQKFEAQLADGADPKTLEHSAMVQEGGQTTFRYMKAIAIGPNQPCLHCHGAQINDGVKQKLNELYPNDKAVGYQAGQIRGAFSFQKPL